MVCSDLHNRDTRERDIRLQTMGCMVTKIVHDIRNPLGSIELISSLLQKELSEDRDKHELLGHIIYGVRNIDTVLSNLLHFTKLPKPRFEAVNIATIINNCLEDMSYLTTKKDIRVESYLPDDIEISCDQALLRQVFLNILLNALQAMTDQGHLTIQVFRNESDDMVNISIKDTGCGIPADDMEKIFDPFYSTKEKGTGLGLTIVHNIVAAHKGAISAHSKQGEGSVFVMALPLKGEDDGADDTSGR